MDIQSFTAAVNAKVAEVEQKAFSIFRFPIGAIKWQLNAQLKPFRHIDGKHAETFLSVLPLPNIARETTAGET